MPEGPDDRAPIGGAHAPLTSTHLTLVPWPDPVIDRVGHDARSEYVERFWLGVIGPSCTWFLRRLAVGFEAEPEGFELDVAECARALGLGAGLGRNAPLGRTVTRCCQFGLTRRFGRDGLAVRRRLPPLARHHLARLPDALQAEHGRWAGAIGGGASVTTGAIGGGASVTTAGTGPASVAPPPAAPPRTATRGAATPGAATASTRTAAPATRGAEADRRAMADDAGRLALGLLRSGHDPESARRSLQGWGAPPALARAAVEWAGRRVQATAVPVA